MSGIPLTKPDHSFFLLRDVHAAHAQGVWPAPPGDYVAYSVTDQERIDAALRCTCWKAEGEWAMDHPDGCPEHQWIFDAGYDRGVNDGEENATSQEAVGDRVIQETRRLAEERDAAVADNAWLTAANTMLLDVAEAARRMVAATEGGRGEYEAHAQLKDANRRLDAAQSA